MDFMSYLMKVEIKDIHNINKIYTPKWDHFILKNKKHRHITFKTIDIEVHGSHFLNIISKTNSSYHFTNKLIYTDYNNEYDDYGVVFHKRDFQKKLKSHNDKYI